VAQRLLRSIPRDQRTAQTWVDRCPESRHPGPFTAPDLARTGVIQLIKKKRNKLQRAIQKKLSRSYLFLFAIFSVVTVGAFDLAAHRQNDTIQAVIEATAKLPSPAQSLLQQPAWDYFHPAWKKEEGWNLLPVMDNKEFKLPTPTADVSDLLTDPENRIEPQFEVTPGLKRRVLFWMEIYAKYSSRFKVIHDRFDPGIIYGVVDVRPLYRVFGTGSDTEVRVAEIERKVEKELKQRLAEAIGISPGTKMSPQERDEIRNFLSSLGALSAPETAKLIGSIRSQTGQRDMFLQALYRSGNLLPHIESVFRRNNLPAALARIPFVESSFNVKALSSVGAVGIWQFMPETAKQMSHSDENSRWVDPLKQTANAARLFQIYRSMLPDWGTTVTSYNSGVGHVRRMVQKYHVKGVEGLLMVQGSDGLGFAGQNFYSEFLAANLVEAYKEKIFSRMLGNIDLSLVFKGISPFPKDICDL